MKRHKISPRSNWQEKLEQRGFLYHTGDNPYWSEVACYEFSMDEVNLIEKSTNDLQEICAEAVQTIIDRGWFERLKLSPLEIQLIENSWNQDHLSMYGRFDLTWNFKDSPKMLEYNADTPTSLYEAAVVQWDWLQDVYPKKDQFNSLHEKLISRWPQVCDKSKKLYFFCMQNQLEDLTQTEYLRDTAHQAGFETEFIFIEDLGWDSSRNIFVGLEGEQINQAFKLYPWEWLVQDQFSSYLNRDKIHLTEPAWKRVLSCKGILPLLWELYPNHPNLLPAYFEKPTSGNFVQKPFVSREGSQIKIFKEAKSFLESKGHVESDFSIYQAYQELPCFDSKYVVIGSWIIGEEAAGMGLREDDSQITQNLSQFVPHFINSERGPS